MTGRLELYPDEENRIKMVWAGVQREFLGRDGDLNVLVELKNVATGRFRESGFVVDVDIANMEMGDDGKLYYSPVINVVERCDPELEHDHMRHAFEVQSGFSDGETGTIRGDGTFGSSKKLIV